MSIRVAVRYDDFSPYMHAFSKGQGANSPTMSMVPLSGYNLLCTNLQHFMRIVNIYNDRQKLCENIIIVLVT